MADTDPLNLVPPIVDETNKKQFDESGLPLSTAFSPRGHALTAHATFDFAATSVPLPKGEYSATNHVFTASISAAPVHERREFCADTHVIFANVQDLIKTSRELVVENRPWKEEDILKTLSKFADDYVAHTRDAWSHISKNEAKNADEREQVQLPSEHYRQLYTCMSFFRLLYVVPPEAIVAPIGDLLMEWLNTHFIAPSTDEGDYLSNIDKPWEDNTFWPYLTRAIIRGLNSAAIFFLDALVARHPSYWVKDSAKGLKTLVVELPRLSKFKHGVTYIKELAKWRKKLDNMRLTFNAVPEDKKWDDMDNWWERIDDILRIFEGHGETLKRVCGDISGDWREVIAAWGIFIDFRLRRDTLHKLSREIHEEMPPDYRNMEEAVHVYLLQNKPVECLRDASQLDPWLAAHMGDLMEPAGLLDDVVMNEEFDLSLRDYYVLSYADYLHCDPTSWRITVEYMYTCGQIGRETADRVLLRVPLRANRSIQAPGGEIDDEKLGMLEEINGICHRHEREDLRRRICRIAAQDCVQHKEYAQAASYCISAEDWRDLGYVVDRLLDEYIHNGADQFTRLAEGMPYILRCLSTLPKAQGVYVHRLQFAVRYAEYHRLLRDRDLLQAAFLLVSLFEAGIAPKSWWGVILQDAVPLLLHEHKDLFALSAILLFLQKLEEIHLHVEQGSSEDYLTVVAKVTKSAGLQNALPALQKVRFALAQYLARCTTINVGGKDDPGSRNSRHDSIAIM